MQTQSFFTNRSRVASCCTIIAAMLSTLFKKAKQIVLGKLRSSTNARSLCELAIFFVNRSSFLSALNFQIDGVVYRGAASALLLTRRFEFGGIRPSTATMECLYRTSNQLHFLFKGNIYLNGEFSRMERMWIEPLSHAEAKEWALLHAQGRDVSHV